MTISYKWLSEYLPETIEPEKLSAILTSIGLEVESMEYYENIKGSLKGIVIGEVVACNQHPNADKLRLTKVDIGAAEPLNIVCGASNVAVGQKVLVATIGTTIYPTVGEPITMKLAKIRGEESQGMICAEDEIGISTNHDGIMVLPAATKVGTKAADYFQPYTDWIYEIGLTPNRMDAMSHLGVAKDVCAYLTHHHNKETRPKSPFNSAFQVDNQAQSIKVVVENKADCMRYAGVSISGITVKESPKWLKEKLEAIGQRPINNIVDITNYILHETGQPLHAFDADQIEGNTIIVKNLANDTLFTTLDDKERKLSENDLMICNGKGEGMCIAGIFGGAKSGVSTTTTNIFIESAWFSPVSIRKSSIKHGLRTEAAVRFEKGVDISQVVNTLKRAAFLTKEIAGGSISSDIIDFYPDPAEKTQVAIKYHYLKKLSGKNYHPDAIKRILSSLEFEIIKEEMDELLVAVPFCKPDISLAADIVEEIIRIDGLDNIEIPTTMTISPAADENIFKENLKEKIAGFLIGQGFSEIVTNSITNSQYYSDEVLIRTIKMINSLSTELDVMRPSMVEPGLETISYNLNRKNKDLQLFEFGKTYHTSGIGSYTEIEHLSLYLTGLSQPAGWRTKAIPSDFYVAKGIAKAVLTLCGIQKAAFSEAKNPDYSTVVSAGINKKNVVTVGELSPARLKAFDIKQPVYIIDFDWEQLIKLNNGKKITYKEVSKFPAVNRDLSLVVNRSITFEGLEIAISKAKISKLYAVQLFDIFESEKLGADKKSMAISFTFMDEEKTLTDKEIDGMMNKLIGAFENELNAEIRK